MHVTNKESDLDLFGAQTTLLNTILSHKEDTLWKVLIFDTFNQQTLKTLFKVMDLREHNITLYMNISERREQLHGVTAFYLVQPTTENIDRIVEDFSEDLYSSVSVHFSSQPSNHILSTLAKSVAGRYPKQLSKIHRVSHSFCGYHVVDRTMALLAGEQQTVNFLAQFKHPPLLIYQKSEQEFAVKLKDRLEVVRTGQFSDTSAHTAVLIVNRDTDLTPLFFHEITYGALMSDVYEMIGYNKVKLGEEVREFDVKDEVWIDRKHMLSSEFDLEREITLLKAKQANLKENMDQAAELNQLNQKLDWHLNRVKDLITQAMERQLNRFSQIGLDLLTTKKLSKDNKKTMLELLQTSTNKVDRLRLVLLYLVCCDDLSSLEEFEKILEGVPKPPTYLQVKERRLKETAAQREGSTKYIKHLAKGLLKNLLSNEKKYLLTRMAEQILRSSFLDGDFETLEVRRTEHRLGQVVVYVRGGACLNEYQNLREYVPEVLYCGDKLLHANDLLR